MPPASPVYSLELPLEPHSQKTPPALTADDLRAPFLAACKPRAEFKLGTEAEKFGVAIDGQHVRPAPFAGEHGVQRVLADLERFQMTPVREYEGGEIIALLRDRASVTLEPAAQLELSGAPFASVHETAAELKRHLSELQEVSAPHGLRWLSLGFHPFATHADLPRVPKLRYRIMEQYLPTRGARGLDMMRRTCTVQVNHDYDSPEDAMRKLRVGLALQPVATAMFANSPFIEGRRGQFLSERANVWCHMDPDRSGQLAFAWNRAATLDDYIEWALDVPMFLVKRGSKVLENTGQTFRSFMTEGYSGATAEPGDWETHLNTLFPDVRLKKTLEMRGADAQPTALLCAIPALWKGLLYDPTALAAAEALIENLTPEEGNAAREAVPSQALAATMAGKPLQRWAEEMVDVAEAGLQRLAAEGVIQGEGEEVYLQPLKALLEKGQCPAEALLEKLGDNPTALDVVEATRV